MEGNSFGWLLFVEGACDAVRSRLRKMISKVVTLLGRETIGVVKRKGSRGHSDNSVCLSMRLERKIRCSRVKTRARPVYSGQIHLIYEEHRLITKNLTKLA